MEDNKKVHILYVDANAKRRKVAKIEKIVLLFTIVCFLFSITIINFLIFSIIVILIKTGFHYLIKKPLEKESNRLFRLVMDEGSLEDAFAYSFAKRCGF